MANEWKKIGSVRVGKTPGSFYLKIDNTVTLGSGDSLFLQDPRKKLDESVAAGRLDAERAAGMKEKIPTYIKYDVVLAPPKK